MTATVSDRLELPTTLRPEPIIVRDPFLEFLGLVPAGGPIAITFAELVKAAGHVCPTVAGAYLILRYGLKALYGDEPALRGNVRVTAYGGPADFGYGPIAQLVNCVIGAAPETGFGGLARGRFRRRDLFLFKRDDIRRNEFDFERLDTGRRVRVIYDPSIIPAPLQLAAAIGPALADAASPDDVAYFRQLWLQRVEDILAAGYRVVNVSEAVQAARVAGERA
ncbi:MAG TPA: hypothetical protein VMW56_03805 [Candidatus Margulisiibacteriota bacterium]|nr:hypothetical protein [Candidatus Margulisiibacteriota bacterium]